MKALQLFLLLFVVSSTAFAQIPDFTETDIYGVEHSLYEDYLDEGKVVIINATATWAGPAWDWHQTGILESFHQEFGDAAIVMDFEFDISTTDEDIFGTGNNTLGDWTEGTSYPILNPTTNELSDLFGIVFVPAVIIICPNGDAYANYENQFIQFKEELGWGNIVTPEYLFEQANSFCDWNGHRNLIEGTVYNDENSNCVDDAETKMPNVHFEISNGNYTYHRVSNENGYFKASAKDSVTYTVTGEVPSPLWDFCVDAQDVYFDGSEDSIQISFALQTTADCPLPEVDISSPLIWRCFPSTIYVHACNTGTTTLEDGVLTVVLDSFLVPTSYSIPPDVINGNVLTFYHDLDVLECLDIEIEVIVDCDVELGYLHCYSAQLTGSNLCGTFTGIAYDEECQENVGSYDPNDKRSFPRGDGDEHFVKANTDIEYQIRFQNTGTFMALNVYITDTISTLYDLNSLRMGASSHDYTFEITEERTLRFNFDNIMLPDSTTDLVGSQGFVSFYLSQKPDLPDGTVLENEANIFFDFNEPILTNKAYLTIGELTSTKDLEENILPFQVQPNPAREQVQINIQETELTKGTWQLYHSSGQLMRHQAFTASQFTILTESLAPGVYLLELKNEEGRRGIQKVVIR